MKRKLRVIFTAYAAAAIAVLAAFAWAGAARAKQYRRYIDASRSRAFLELVESVEQMDSALQKCVYATSPSLVCACCTDAFGKAMAAQAALGELPFADLSLENTSGFIGRAGDYVYMLSKKAAGGEAYAPEELDNLSRLSAAASSLSASLTGLGSRLSAGEITISEIERGGAFGLSYSAGADLSEGFRAIESDFPDIPALIYDGPFSQHIASKKSALLHDLPEVGMAEARRKAAELLGEDESDLGGGYEREGALPAYVFTSSRSGRSAEITKRGALPLSICGDAGYGGGSISEDEARRIAAEFLARQGFENMRESYMTLYEGRVLINFAAAQGDVICYPDLVKVSVSLSSGEIVGLEAMGYIMNHHTRELPENAVSEEAAARAVPESLKILSRQTAVIPTAGQYEKYCYEFKCEGADGRHYIVYANAATGEQEKILILIEDENGTLTL